MPMTPIHRIPLNADTTLTQIIESEGPHACADDVMIEMTEHSAGMHTEVTMDWAAQIRDETGMDWGTCISTAMTMYFG